MKRSPHLQPLSHDHYASLAFAGRLLRALDDDGDPEALAAEVAALWERELTRHFHQEELLLLPLLQASQPNTARQLIEEHEQIEALVGALAEARSDRRALLRTFGEALRAHIRFEEREVFPAVERVADAATLADIGARLQ